MKALIASLLITIGLITIIGCASDEPQQRLGPDFNDRSRAPGSAMSDEAMFNRKESEHSEKNHWQFYYKHCLLDDNDTRVYGCNGPF
jgi:hypothetical protein